MTVHWNIHPFLGTWLSAVVIVILFALIVIDYIKRFKSSPQTMLGYLLLRCTALFIAAVIMFVPERITTSQPESPSSGSRHKTKVIVLNDISESIPSEISKSLSSAADSLLTTAGIQDPEIIPFAARPALSSESVQPASNATDISSALLAGMSYAPGAILLLSDGQWNSGADPAVVSRTSISVPVFVISPHGRESHTLGFEMSGISETTGSVGITAPEISVAGEMFDVSARFRGIGKGKLVIRLRGPVVDTSPATLTPVSEQRFDITSYGDIEQRTARLSAPSAGTWIIEAELIPRDTISPGTVLKQTAILRCRSGPLRLALYQSAIGWDTAAAIQLLQNDPNCRINRIRAFGKTSASPPEPADTDVLIAVGVPVSGISAQWKAAVASYIAAGKGILVIGAPDEYISWRNAAPGLPSLLTSDSTSAVSLAPINIDLTSESRTILATAPFTAPITQWTAARPSPGAIALFSVRGSPNACGILARSGSFRIIWLAEPPFSSIFHVPTVGSGNPREILFLDLVYFLANRKRSGEHMRLESLRSSAAPGDMVPLSLTGVPRPKLIALTLEQFSPSGTSRRPLDPASLVPSASGDSSMSLRVQLDTPGLNLFSVKAEYADNSSLLAGTACMVQGVDRELSDTGPRTITLERITQSTGGEIASLNPDNSFTPPDSMLQKLKQLSSGLAQPEKSTIFELHRWWLLVLIALFALFAEWALRTR